MKILLSLLVFVPILSGSVLADDDALAKRLRPLIESHEGKVALAVKHLKSGATFTAASRIWRR